MADYANTKAPPRQRRLLLLRHAKSAWPEDVPDHARPLAERGEKAAPDMGNHMAREHLVPDLAIVSDARRTQETWDLVKSRLPGTVASRVTPALYDASATQMLEVLRETEAEADTVLIIGHNPGLQELALMLVGEGQLHVAMAGKFPTGALAVIDFAVGDWSSVEPGSGILADFLTPRMLR